MEFIYSMMLDTNTDLILYETERRRKRARRWRDRERESGHERGRIVARWSRVSRKTTTEETDHFGIRIGLK